MTVRPDCISENVPLAPYTTFKIGGQADFLATITSEEELIDVLTWSKQEDMSVMILGGGSNVVFADAGYRGLVLHINIKGIEVAEQNNKIFVTAAAGLEWDEFVSKMVKLNFSGLENLSGIPGKVGASPVQNIGAYGVEVGEKIILVRVYNPQTKNFSTLEKNECDFSYRHSFFKNEAGKNLIITAVTFLLDKKFKPVLGYPDLQKYFSDSTPTIEKLRSAILEIRRHKFPDLGKVGTAGSFFKNPIIDSGHYARLTKVYPELPGYAQTRGVKVSAAWLIDNVAQAKGIREGNVGTHGSQALVFVNYGQATATELDIFATKISDLVFKKTGIQLAREVCFVGEG